MLTRADLRSDQLATIDRLFEYDRSLVVAPMGAGKTVCTLTAAVELLEKGELKRVLISAPLKPAESVWRQEMARWRYLSGEVAAVAVGSPAKRREAVNTGARIVVTNHENLPWMLENYGSQFDGIVLDEIDCWKDTGGARFKRVRYRLKHFKWRVGLTGTPVSENWTALFGMVLLLDDGERYGRNRQRWLDKWFMPEDYERRKWGVIPGMESNLLKRIEDLIYVAEDYRKDGGLPPLHTNIQYLDMPDRAMELYRKLAKVMLLDGVTPANQAVLTNKLLQIASGFVYRDDGSIQWVHLTKQDRARDGLAVYRGVKMPVLVVCNYIAELRGLRKHAQLFDSGLVDAWNRREIPAMAIHPKSAGHGLNLAQGGRNLLWMSPVWSRRAWDQTNARLWRTGQQAESVYVDQLIMRGTIDEVVLEVRNAKGEHHEALLKHLGKL